MSLADVVTRTLKKNGELASLQWTDADFLADSSDAAIELYVLIQTKSFSIGNGGWEKRLTAILPATARDVAGATLTVRGQTHTITKLDATYKRDQLVMQEVLLS
ncbi:MAG: hypothetical protein K2X80_04065 [Pseudomonadaceae bacterium]|nr:hypothetical protein [Pseudomonadaceae bacterium]